MARPLRIQYPGALYHIISRGIDGRNILGSDLEKQHFLKILLKVKEIYKIEIYLHCLLDNHYHLTIETLFGNLSQTVHWLNSMYTSWYNNLHERKGHLFQGRYKSIIVDKDEYLLELSRYVHLNPVKAGIINHPEEYKWSSYRAYLGIESSSIINTEFILNQFSKNLSNARVAYKKFVEEDLGIDDDLMKKVVKGFILGSEEFIKTIEVKGENFKDDREIPQLRMLKKKIDINDFFYRISKTGFVIDNKGRWNNLRRDIIVYLCRVLTLVTYTEIGERFGLKDATVSYICKKVEKSKDKDNVKIEIDNILKILDF